ncbi:MAG: hypothetical protein RLZZ381_461, partial [Cyanobacteriota bacterium]
MNNLPQSPEPKEPSQTMDSHFPRASWLGGIYNLPLNRKINLIPWFSCGGLVLVLGVGGLILQGTLKQHLIEQTESRLNIKSKVILLSETQLKSNLEALGKTLTAITEEQDYSAVYLLQADGTLVLASSSTKIAGAASTNLALPDNQILEQAVNDRGKVVHQATTIEGHKYVLAAQTISDRNGNPLGVLVHGTAMQSLNSILKSSLLAQSLLSLIILIFIIYLSRILGRAIAEPIESLHKVAQDFSAGNFGVR